MKLFHVTTIEAAQAILRDGFRNGRGNYLTYQIHEGIWLSDVPLDAGEIGAEKVDAVLTVEINGHLIRRYEWIEDVSMGYREWLIPADLLNSRAKVNLSTA